MNVPELDPFALVVLRRGPRADEFTEPELDDLQARHLAHMDDLRAKGILVINGPFVDQPDETMRGLCVFRCSLEEARALAEADPSVQAGRLAVEVFTWLVPKGSMPAP